MQYSGYLEYATTDKGVMHPKEWPAERLRFAIISNPVKSEVAGWEEDTLVNFVPMEAVCENGGIDLSQEKPIGDVYGGYTYFADGDIVIAKITPCFENGKGAISEGLKNGVAFGTTEFHVLRPLKGISKRWLFYLTISDAFRKVGASEMLGAGGQKRVPETFIKNFRTGIPTFAEQQKIADFLDWKTGQIDVLISKKKQLIEKLKEKRMAMITQAVTKGLDTKAPMRDSGIPWLGKVPEHWKVMKLHHIVRMKSGSNITSADIEETGEYPVYGGNGVRGYFKKYTHEGSFVLIGRQGALCGNINYAHGKFWASEHAVVATPDRELDINWLGETLRAMNLNQYSESAAQPGLSVEEIGRLRMPFPPVYEQGEIANFISIETAKIDTLTNVTVQTILRLTEYRTALITAATTGKIDVRNVKIGGAA